MRLAMALLAGACVVLGLGSVLVLPVLTGLLDDFGGLGGTPALATGLSLTLPRGFGGMSPPLVALGLAVLAGGALAGVALAANRGLRRGDTWGCGRIGQTARMEYTSTAFAEPLRRVFAELYRPTEDLTIDVHPDSRYFVQSRTYRSEIRPWFERYLYAPLVGRISAWADRTRALQSGSAHVYLTYLVVALVALLAIALARSG
jgi:hypothetical protein